MPYTLIENKTRGIIIHSIKFLLGFKLNYTKKSINVLKLNVRK
jgi:hypothetical protein